MPLEPPSGIVPRLDGLVSSEAVKPHRVIGQTLDSLVRSTRIGDPAAVGLNRKFHRYWLDFGTTPVQLQPTQLVIGGKIGLSASADAGRWLLPAFMSGLRALSLRPDASSDDLSRLLAELAAIRANLDSIRTFRDWLWCDGAVGFNVTLSESFVEIIDSDLVADVMERNVLATRTTAAVDDWNRLARIAAKELDAAAIRDEFRVPIELLRQRAERDPLALASVDAARLRTQCEEASLWSEIEMSTVLAHPVLRSAVSSQRLAQRVLALIEGADTVGARVLSFLAALGEGSDDYSRQLLNALEGDALGEGIAHKLDLEECGADALFSFAAAAQEGTARGLMHGLIARASGDGRALALVLEIAARAGVLAWAELIDPRRIDPAVAAALVRGLIERQAPIQELATFAERLSPKAAATALVAVPQLFNACNDLAESLLVRSPRQCVALLQCVLAIGPEGASLAGSALARSRGEGWSHKMLQRTLDGLVRSGLGRAQVLPLAGARGVSVPVRRAALRALEAEPEVLAEALRFRAGEVFESPEVRQLFATMRQRLKAVR
ncbi:MAG TPA: hypothetical protein VHM19_15500 [Polyangiales bacterium]|nr:hypothetical protein [Polyangiales bacterium]